eukprot:3108113-Amphidinium_carterae.1
MMLVYIAELMAEKTVKGGTQGREAKGYCPREDVLVNEACTEQATEVVDKVSLQEIEGSTPAEYALWVQAMEKELAAFSRYEVKDDFCEAEARAQGLLTTQPLPMMLVATRKPGDNGQKKCKARVVVCGNWAKHDPKAHVYAQVPDWPHIRSAVNVAASRSWSLGVLDVSTAFLNAPLEKEVWGRPPAILERAGLIRAGTVWRFKRAIYGLRESPRAWSKERDAQLEGRTFEISAGRFKLLASTVAPQIMRIVMEAIGELYGLLVLYVDDVMILAEKELQRAVKSMIAGIWSVTDGGELLPEDGGTKAFVNFLGVRFRRALNGAIKMDQRRWLKAVMQKLGWPTLRSSRVLPQIELGRLTDERGKDSYKEDLSRAQMLTGILQWLASRTRPDLSCITNVLATVLCLCPAYVCGMAKHCFRYLVETWWLDLETCGPDEGQLSQQITEASQLQVYGDASLAPGGGHSRSGYCAMWHGGLMDYSSSKQGLTALSSCESELRAAAEAWMKGSLLQALLEEWLGKAGPLQLFTDNSAVLIAVKCENISWRNRHFSMLAMRLSEEIKANNVAWSWVSTSDMKTDGFTKVLQHSKLSDFRRILNLKPTDFEE